MPDGWARDDGGGAGPGSDSEEQSLVGKGAAASSSAGMTSWPQRRYIMALFAMSMWLVRTNNRLGALTL